MIQEQLLAETEAGSPGATPKRYAWEKRKGGNWKHNLLF